jgi:hypothetical protein
MTDEARFEALRVRLAELIGRSRSLARQLGDLDLGKLRGPADLALLSGVAQVGDCGAPERGAAVRRPRGGAYQRLPAPLRFAWENLRT